MMKRKSRLERMSLKGWRNFNRRNKGKIQYQDSDKWSWEIPEDQLKSIPFITSYEWEEDGKLYSSHKVKAGDITLYTGDAGLKMLDEAFRAVGEINLRNFKKRFGKL